MFIKSSKRFTFSVFLFSLLFIYVAFAWDEWSYGGCLGQRTMVQTYPILSLALACFFERIWKMKILTFSLITAICSFFIIYNLWLTHHCHKGGIVHVGQMTRTYFWSNFMSFNSDDTKLRYLDNLDRVPEGDDIVEKQLYQKHFDTLLVSNLGSEKLTLDTVEIPQGYKWVRAFVEIKNEKKEWDVWKMSQFGVVFTDEKNNKRSQAIRVDRLLDEGNEKELYVELKIRHSDYKRATVVISFWDTESVTSQKTISKVRLVGYKRD